MELKKLIMNRPHWLSSSERDGNEHIILSKEISLDRNFIDYPFPHKMSQFQKSELFSHVVETIKDTPYFNKECNIINITDISDIAKTLLFERDFITLDMIKGSGDRGVIVCDNNLSFMINCSNHLRIHRPANNNKLQDVWEELSAIDTTIGKELTYAYDSSKGFLMSRPSNAGTGLTVSFTLHLPGLVHTETIEQVLSGAAQLGMRGDGKFKVGHDSWGSIFTLEGGNFIASSEEEIISTSQDIIDSIVEKELEARAKLFSEASIEMLDKIWRSFGVLKYARVLSVPQLINLTSTLRLGIERGVDVHSLTLKHIDSIISSALQGSVTLLMQNKVKDSVELDIQRAEIVRTILDV